MKFAVFTDLHYDSIHDGDRRIRELIKSVKKENVDFVIELGDLCYPTEENKHIITKVKELGVASDENILCEVIDNIFTKLPYMKLLISHNMR